MIVLTRRCVLVASCLTAGAGLTGCSASDLPVVGRDPDEEVRRAVAADEGQLVALYRAATRQFPDLRRPLSDLRDQHREHLAAVWDSEPPVADPPPDLPRAAGAALAKLQRIERRAGRRRAVSCAAASDGELASVLARIGASESAHATYLGPGGPVAASVTRAAPS